MSARDESAELAAVVAREGALPVPGVPEPQAPAGGYPPALPWARLLDGEDLSDFVDELADAATRNASGVHRLAAIEEACNTWRLIAEAQHGHNTAPGPDAMTSVFSPVVSLREPEGEFHSALHHTYRVGHDLPETGGASGSGACKACGSLPEQWCPDCGCCQKGCFGGNVDNPCGHASAPWGAQ